MYVVIEYARFHRGEKTPPVVKGEHEFAPGVSIARNAPRKGVHAWSAYWYEDEVAFEGSAVECAILALNQYSGDCADALDILEPLIAAAKTAPGIHDRGGYSPRWGRTHSWHGEASLEWGGRVWTIRGRRADFSGDMQFRAADGALRFESDRGEIFSV